MAERYHTYYRVTYHESGVHGPVTTKKQMLNEIETSLLYMTPEENMTMSIRQFQMTLEQFKNRDDELKNYGYAGIVQ